MAGNGIDVSIVIPTRNTRELLTRCLRSIRAASVDLSVEVLVVDNGSNDGTVETVAGEFPEVRLIRNETNRGFAEATNQGLELSGGRHLMLLNSDTEVGPEALTLLVDYMERNPRVGACGPLLRYPDGKIQRSCYSFESPVRHFLDMLAIGRIAPGTRLQNLNARFDHRSTRPVDWILGAALLARRDVYDRIGGLDERFRIHCNDSDWCQRIGAAGWEIHYVHEAEVVHHSGVTIRREDATGAIEDEMLRNLFDYHRKYYGRMGVAWLRFWLVIGFGGRSMLALIGARGEGRDDRVRKFERLAVAGLTGN